MFSNSHCILSLIALVGKISGILTLKECDDECEEDTVLMNEVYCMEMQGNYVSSLKKKKKIFEQCP